jgi:four helix bundle protein
VGSFRDLLVWRKAFELCLSVYRATDPFPSDERFGLTSELRKTARSVVCNIAEGQRRTTHRDFARFLDIAMGSSAELETQVLLAAARGYLSDQGKSLLRHINDVNRMLIRLQGTLRSPRDLKGP